ncbi:MAG TPA: 50S ribosomal protein L11 methyltransferase [Thermoanaerobaculia bacterium]|nr:50S ribosomal protein L11 methyltransferase [Thermoanaerobaculia bacterium]
MARTAFEVVRIEAPAELEEELVARLWTLGCEGSWSEEAGPDGRIALHAFFEAGTTPAGLAFEDARVVTSAPERVGEQDWQRTWRERSGPIPLGRRFLVDPREPAEVGEPVDPGDRILLRLPARTAFGVGSHESTRLAVELLESCDVAGRRVLDVGTGTGILAFAALHLGAREVVAFDLDPAAALLLPGYIALNRLRFRAFVGSIAALAIRRPAAGPTEASSEGEGEGLSAGFDLATVNVVPHEIRDELSRLAQALRPSGRALFSGILCSELDEAVSVAAGHGLECRLQRLSGEWAAFVAERVR